MKHLFAGYDSFSALYRAEIFHGDLPENETMLDDDYRVAVVEKFGYGMSDVVDTERDYETMVDECRNALEKAGVEAPYILCPYSKSGGDTLIWAQKYPDEVEAVVSIDMAFPEHFGKMGIDTKQLKTSSTFMGVARATGIIRLFVPNSSKTASVNRMGIWSD